MKTLLLSEIFPPRTGGSGRWFWEVYRRLDPRRFAWAVGETPGHESFDAAHSFSVQRLPLSMPQWGVLSWRGSRDYWNHVRRIRQIVQDHGIEKIHCGRCLPEGVISLALKKWIGLPYLCYVHGEDVSTAKNSREHAFLIRRVLWGAEHCIANSHNTARILREQWRLSDQRVRVLHPGVDTRLFVPSDRSPSIRHRLGWGDRCVILTVGRLQRRKGQDTVIRALPRILSRVPQALYVIVGSGDERDSLESLVRELNLGDHVQFRDEPDDQELVHCYQQCDLFVLANREVNGDIEGFGMVLLEAQACGKPVVAGNSGGTAETLLDGETGYIVPCQTPDQIAELLPELLADPDRSHEMGYRGRKWVEQRFSWEARSAQALEVFRHGQAKTSADVETLNGPAHPWAPVNAENEQ